MYNKTLYLLSLLLAVVAARPTAESSLGDTIRDGCADPGPFQCALLIEAASDGQQEVGIIGGSCGSNILTGGDVASTSTGNNNNDPINYHGVLSTAYGPTLELWAQRINMPWDGGINGVSFVYNGQSHDQQNCLLKEGPNTEWVTLQCNFSC